MAMFLESNNTSHKEVKNSDSVLAILEDLMDLTLEMAAFNESAIQEEYTILTEESEPADKEEKKSGLVEKVKRFLIEFYRKIVALIGRVKQKLISIFRKKEGNIKIYKSYKNYLDTVFNGIADVLADSANLDTLEDWIDRIKSASKELTNDDIIEVDASSFNKMISDMENFSKTASDALKQLEIESARSEFIMKLNRWDTKKYKEILNAVTKSLSILPKAFPKE
jgi:ethanolamine utilization protein EutA (predicted chaperonin)